MEVSDCVLDCVTGFDTVAVNTSEWVVVKEEEGTPDRESVARLGVMEPVMVGVGGWVFVGVSGRDGVREWDTDVVGICDSVGWREADNVDGRVSVKFP